MKGVVNQVFTEGKGDKSVSKAIVFEQNYLEEYKSQKFKTRRRVLQVIMALGVVGAVSDMIWSYAGKFSVIFAIMALGGFLAFNSKLVQPQVSKEWWGKLPHPYAFDIKPGEYVKDDVVDVEVIVKK